MTTPGNHIVDTVSDMLLRERPTKNRDIEQFGRRISQELGYGPRLGLPIEIAYREALAEELPFNELCWRVIVAAVNGIERLEAEGRVPCQKRNGGTP